MLKESRNPEDKGRALPAAKAFEDAFSAKSPKAVAKVAEDLDKELTFYDFPEEHQIHLKITNLIESTPATVRLRTKVEKGTGSTPSRLRPAGPIREDRTKVEKGTGSTPARLCTKTKI